MTSNPTRLAEAETGNAIVLVQDHNPKPAYRNVLVSTYHLSGLFRAVAVAALTALAGCADEDEPSVCAIDGGVTRCALPE